MYEDCVLAFYVICTDSSFSLEKNRFFAFFLIDFDMNSLKISWVLETFIHWHAQPEWGVFFSYICQKAVLNRIFLQNTAYIRSTLQYTHFLVDITD